MVKATTNIFRDYIYAPEVLEIPDQYKKKPHGFEKYSWVTKDERVIPIKEMNDNHLVNTYKMIVRTILYAKDLSDHSLLSVVAQNVVKICGYHVRFIAYELHLRQEEYTQKKLSSPKKDQWS